MTVRNTRLTKGSILLALVLSASFILYGCSSATVDAPKKETYTQISQETAKEMMEQEDDYVIVDVRRQDEYDAGHIPGAILIPNESIGCDPPEALPDYGQIILIYCRTGNRSKQAAEKLAAMGYRNIYEFGGITTWTGEIVTEDAADESSNAAEPAADSAGPAADSTKSDKGDTNGGDFSLTGSSLEWIHWDGNNDGEEEQISFDFIDNGDEAPSLILVTLEVGGSSEAYIEPAGRIVRIFDKEDEEGPYLLVEYNYENMISEKADAECIVRLREDEIVVENRDL